VERMCQVELKKQRENWEWREVYQFNNSSINGKKKVCHWSYAECNKWLDCLTSSGANGFCFRAGTWTSS